MLQQPVWTGPGMQGGGRPAVGRRNGAVRAQPQGQLAEGHTWPRSARHSLTCSLNSSRRTAMHCCSTCLSSRVRTDATASPATTDISTLCCFCRRGRKAWAVHSQLSGQKPLTARLQAPNREGLRAPQPLTSPGPCPSSIPSPVPW